MWRELNSSSRHVSLSEDKPKINVSGDDSRESEGDTDTEEVTVPNLAALLTENTDPRYISIIQARYR